MEPLGYIIAIIVAMCAGMMIVHESDEWYIAKIEDNLHELLDYISELEDKIEFYENGGAVSGNYEKNEDRILQIRQNK